MTTPTTEDARTGSSTRAAQVALVTLGCLAGAWGAYELISRGWSNLVAAAWWLAGGVVLHDAVLAPIVLGVCLPGARVVPTRVRGTVTAALVVWGTVTVLAIPVLGRFGARTDNPTLLDRDYAAGFVAFTLLTALVAVLAVLAGVSRDRRDRRRTSA